MDEVDDLAVPSTSKEYNFLPGSIIRSIDSIGNQKLETALIHRLVGAGSLHVDDIYDEEASLLLTACGNKLGGVVDGLAFASIFMTSALLGNNVKFYTYYGKPLVINLLGIYNEVSGGRKSTIMQIVLKDPCDLAELFGHCKGVLLDQSNRSKIIEHLADCGGRGSLIVDEWTTKLLAELSNNRDNYKTRSLLNEFFNGDKLTHLSIGNKKVTVPAIRGCYFGTGHPMNWLKGCAYLGKSTDGLIHKTLAYCGTNDTGENDLTLPRDFNIGCLFDLMTLGILEGHKSGVHQYKFSKEALELLQELGKESDKNRRLYRALNCMRGRNVISVDEDLPQKLADCQAQPRFVDMVARIAICLFFPNEYCIRAFARGEMFLPESFVELDIEVKYVRRAMKVLLVCYSQRLCCDEMLTVLARTHVSSSVKINEILYGKRSASLFKKIMLMPGIVIPLKVIEKFTGNSKQEIQSLLETCCKEPYSERFVGCLVFGRQPLSRKTLCWVKPPDPFLCPAIFIEHDVKSSDYRDAWLATNEVLQTVHAHERLTFEQLMCIYSKMIPNWFPNSPNWSRLYDTLKATECSNVSTTANMFPPINAVADQSSSAAMIDYLTNNRKTDGPTNITPEATAERKNLKLKFLKLCRDSAIRVVNKKDEGQEIIFRERNGAQDGIWEVPRYQQRADISHSRSYAIRVQESLSKLITDIESDRDTVVVLPLSQNDEPFIVARPGRSVDSSSDGVPDVLHLADENGNSQPDTSAGPVARSPSEIVAEYRTLLAPRVCTYRPNLRRTVDVHESDQRPSTSGDVFGNERRKRLRLQNGADRLGTPDSE